MQNEPVNTLGLKQDGSFRFHIPLDLTKSRDGKVYIEGIASLQTPDIAGETVIQKGMDLSYFLKRGFFNDNHAKDSSGKVGVPTYAKHTPKGLHVKGYLLDTPRAQGIVELADALQKSGGDRQLGFSVEGKVQERDGRIIKKSWIKDIAITAEPVHPGTYMEIVKSLSARIENEGYIEDPVQHSTWSKIEDTLTKSVADALQELKKNLPDLSEVEGAEKSLEAGHENPPQTGGDALRKESLEGELKNQDIPQPEAEEDEDEEKEKNGQRRLTKSQAVELVVARGYSGAAARRIAGLLFDEQFVRFLKGTQE